MQKLICFPILFFLHACLFAQGEFVITLNHLTGEYQKNGSAIAGISYVYAEDRALDEANGVYYFPSAIEAHRLYGIKLADGTIQSNPEIGDLQYFQFDNIHGKLYGIEQAGADDRKYLVRIDPLTGVHTRLGNGLPGSAIIQGDYATFDEMQAHFIFLDSEQKLYTLSAADGHVVYSPAVTVVGGGELMHLAFDQNHGILYGLVYRPADLLHVLVQIDKATGVCTPIGNGITEGFAGGSITLDETNRQMIFLYYQSDLLQYNVSTIDLEQGELVVWKNIAPLDLLDNVLSAKFDNTNQKLYAIHWDNLIESSAVKETPDAAIKASPNPFSEQTLVEWPAHIQWHSLTLLDTYGHIIENLPANRLSVRIDKGSLPAGIYYLKGVEISGKVMIRRLVVAF